MSQRPGGACHRYRRRDRGVPAAVGLFDPPSMDRALLSWPSPDPANPYLVRLGLALGERGVRVRSSRYLAALCALPRGARWLHLHWPEWMLHDPSRARYRARTAYLFALLDLARAQGVSLAWTAHNLLGHDDPHPDLGTAGRSALLRRCQVVFGHFPSAESDLRALGFRGRFVLTPHPHFADDYTAPDRAVVRAALGVADGELVLASVGSIEPYKNLAAFARAFREAAPSTGVRWVVSGRASDTSAARSLTDAVGGDPRITVRYGFAAREALSALVTAADAVVLPYRDFYTSGAAVLSLSLGTPVVGPARHHLATLAGEGFFVPLDPVDGPGVARAIAAVRAMDPGARDAARRHAMATDWPATAAAVDAALFGAAE